MDWMYDGIECTSIPDGKIGFVYLIEYTDNTYYIGKKLACSYRKKKPLVGMRKNARRMVMTEHKWKEYIGSSDFTDTKTIARKTILEWCGTKQLMSYIETELHFKHDVLRDQLCVNRSIMGKYYRKIFKDIE